MKQILLTLFSILAFSAHAVNLRDAYTPTEVKSGGCLGVATGTVTYALNSALTGTTSSVIDLGAFEGVFVTITGTAGTGAAFVDALWSNTPTAATFNSMYTLSGPLSECIEKKGRYVKFRTSGAIPTQRVSLFYDPITATAATATIAGTVTVTGTLTTAGNVSISTGVLTTAGNVSINAGTSVIGAVGVTSTTMPSWTVVSTASYSVTGTTRVDLATVAGSGRIYMYKLSALGPGAGLYYGTAPSTTWVPPVSYYAVSTTPVVEDYLTTGTFLQLSATASAVTVTAQVTIYSLTQVVP